MISHTLKALFYVLQFLLEVFFISEVKKLGILNLGEKKSATSNKKNYPHVEEI